MARQPILRFFACLAAAWGVAACSTGSSGVPQEAGAPASSGGTGACTSTYPVSQGASEPCCSEWGADACGAGLFCAAFDGRTQRTCYPEHARTGGQTCTGDNQCLSNACDVSGVCKGDPNGECVPSIGCGTLPVSGVHFTCTKDGGELRCRPCSSSSVDPACGATADGGTTNPGPRGCVPKCALDADCQNSCPAQAGGVACCDTTVGVCWFSKAAKCPTAAAPQHPPSAY